MTKEDIKRIHSEYLNDTESTFEMEEVFALAIKAIDQGPRKMVGSWIKSQDSYGNNHFTCPFCEHDIATKADTLGDNYCSNCGEKLQESEPQERSDKE